MYRILLAVQPQLLCDALRQRIDIEPDLKVVGQVDNELDLLVAIKAQDANVVIRSTSDDLLPGIYSHLLQEYPDLKVVAICPLGTEAVICEKQITYTTVPMDGPVDLMSAVRFHRAPAIPV